MDCTKKKNVQITDLTVLTMDLLHGLGATATVNGDRCSDYYVLAKDESASTDVSVSLTEERSGLPQNEWGYSLHVIDDITPSDCTTYHDAGQPMEPKILVKAMLEMALNNFLFA